MRFDNGMLGVCISVCAVMGMVLSGFVLSVGEYEQTVTGYEYVTDVSGLFEYSDQPTFLDYNPAANWSGYYTDTPGVTDGIDYESRTEPANSYPIGQEDIPDTSGTADLSTMGLTQMSPPVNDNTPTSYWPWGIVYDEPPVTVGIQVYDVPRPNVATVETLISSLSGTSTTDITRITLGVSDTSPIILQNSAWTYYDHDVPLSPTTHYATASYYRDQAVNSFTVDHESGVVVAYDLGGSILWRGSAANCCIVYGGEAPDGSAHQFNLTTSIQYTTYHYPTPIYMDISQGVSLSSAETVNWANEYRNGRIDILFRAASASVSYSNTFTMPLTDLYGALTEEEMALTVTVPQNGNVTVTLASGSETDTVTLGKWRNFMVSLDTVNGRYTAMPVTDFVSFTTYEAQESSGQDLELGIDGRAFTEMSVTYAGSSLTFGVVDTATFLDTYDAVMVDPHLDISDYFTELADLRLNFFSFAVYGDSITINSQTYAVNTSAQINLPDTSGDEPVDRWLTLTNIYITFEGSNTYITFNNDNQTIDLGPTVSTEISMAGVWYFTTGLYEGYTTTQTALEWDYHNFIYDSNAAIVAFLGILAVGTVLGSRLVRGGMSVLDYIVVGFAALCAVVLMVV